MKVNAQFFLVDGDIEREITTMNDLSFVPFEVGDIVHLNVEDLYPKDLEQFNELSKGNFVKANDEKSAMFDRKNIEITSKTYYNTIHFLKEDRLIVEYFCKFVEK